MSRTKRFAYGLVSSYAAIGINTFYTLASVPLALYYLNKTEFGIWALVTQLAGYLILLEFGMSGSVARSLSDHKDDMSDGIYGSILKTGARIFAIQGLVILAIGALLSQILPSLLDLPAESRGVFSILLFLQALFSAVRIASAAISSPLWCHQRLDLSNLASSISLVTSFALLWIGFRIGWGLYSLVLATGLSSSLSIFISWGFCRKLGYYPRKEYRGKYDGRIFRELFVFGRDIFILSLGAQLANASQVIVISRIIGVETAAIWAVATKIFGMAQLLVGKIFESSAGGLAEMVVRREQNLLLKRFRDIVRLSAVVAVVTGSGIALLNGPFIEVWTSGKVSWPIWNNLLLGGLLVASGINRCHINLVGVSKKIKGMKYVYLTEGFSFVLLSIYLGKQFGITGILAAALGCNILVSGIYGIANTAGYFGVGKLQVAMWPARPSATLLVTAGLFASISVPAFTRMDSPMRLGIGAFLFTCVILPAVWFLSFDSMLRATIRSLTAKAFHRARIALGMN